jgi:hypothetical protein
VKTDSEIERDVKAELGWNPDLKSTDIAISVKVGAGQYKHFDIENAAAHLHGMIDAKHGEHGSASAGKHRQAHARRSRSA